MFSHSEPQRTCTACRAKTDKGNLIRIVKSPEGKPVVDKTKKLPGRGVYICPDLECIELAKKSGSLSRALKAKIDDENFWSELEKFAENFALNENLKIRSILGLSRKSGALLIGSDRIESSKEKKILVMSANDCSEGVKNFLASNLSVDISTSPLHREDKSEKLAPPDKGERAIKWRGGNDERFIHITLNMNVKELSELIGSRGGVQILGLPLNSGFAKKIMSLNNMKGEKPFER